MKRFTYANIDEYLPWLQANPNGFVVNFRWKGGKHLVVHRATCRDIAKANVNYGRKGDDSGKMCSRDIAELRAWADSTYSKALDPCGHCRAASG
jgi:hypothetical protein